MDLREFKFRAYHKEKGYNKIFPVYSFSRLYVWEDLGLYELKHDRKDCIVMQFTGLVDKNGTDIYEGDIIEYQGYPENPDYRDARLVKFVKGGFILRYLWSNDNKPHESEYMMQLWYATIPERYVVIGNIHENPELLEKK